MSDDPLTAIVQRHLGVLKKHIHKVLKDTLPEICTDHDNWWEIMVRGARIKGTQMRDIQDGNLKTLGKLDVVSLCYVLKHHFKDVLEHIQSHDEQRNGYLTCDAIINLRNQISHQGIDDVMSPEDALHGLTNLKKMGILLFMPTKDLANIDADQQIIARQLAGITISPGGAAVDSLRENEESSDFGSPSFSDYNDERLSVQADQGISLHLLAPDAHMVNNLESALSESTFIGIDFGTSTTVVSRVFFDPNSNSLKTEPIPIFQKDPTGRTIEGHLLPTCVCWHNEQLFVGDGAASMKTELTPGVDIWSSFKMELGIDLGPKYYRSKLDGSVGPVEIRKPQDVATYFFEYLREQIEAWVLSQGLPSQIQYAVSVPASFEPNQRLDLCRVMDAAGIQVHNNSIIDEPNAAFISYLLDTLENGDGIVRAFGDRERKVMVFDFGAGTCDISVLNVYCADNRIISRNLAISQFRALGGDNIDRCIARNILWPAMQKSISSDVHIRSIELEQVILPRLLPAAEELKIQCCKRLKLQSQGSNVFAFEKSDELITAGPVKPVMIRDCRLSLDKPSMCISQFFKIMESFLDPESSVINHDEVISIFEPITNALKKAAIPKDQLDMVLFIGGSAQNPLVQDAVTSYVGRFVECVVGRDVRTPVSRGAALHSLAWNGLGMQFIKPIVSESIYIVTRGGILHPILLAGTPIPSPEVDFSDSLIVANDGQEKIELPICVSSEKKILHVIELSSNSDCGFQSGDRITVSCHLDENKLLHVTAKIGTVMARSTVTNPLANESLTPEETRRLLARQRLNESIVKGGGKPEPVVLEDFAKACADSDFHLEAAESFEALERISKRYETPDNATLICFHYGRANKSNLSDEWAEIAYRRRPTWVSAFNLAITMRNKGKIGKSLELLEEAKHMNPGNPVILESYARECRAQGRENDFVSAYTEARAKFKEWLSVGNMDRYDIDRAIRIAKYFDDEDFEHDLSNLRSRLSANEEIYDQKNLAATTIQSQRTH